MAFKVTMSFRMTAVQHQFAGLAVPLEFTAKRRMNGYCGGMASRAAM